MSETNQGRLRWIAEKGRPRVWRLAWTSKSGKDMTSPPDAGTLAPDFAAATDNDIEVDYELGPTSRPINIRRAGTAWKTPSTPPRARPDAPHQQNAPTTTGPQAGATREGHFHNPYNFIPALPPVEQTTRGDLGQGRPVGHKAWYDGFFSGRITVDIEVKTPLLVPDASRARKDRNGHVILPLLTEPDGTTPKLPPTSFKGALRSAYEAITNSRLAVFQGHDRPLGRRMEAGEGLRMVPARIGDDGRLELWMGTLHPKTEAEFHRNRPQANGRPPGDLMYAAWLHQYDRGGRRSDGPAYHRDAIKYPNGSRPSHGDRVVCWLRKAQKVSATGQARFSYWRVEAICKGDSLEALPPATAFGNPPARFGNSHMLVAGEPPIRARGYVSITNQNIGNKHDERVFFIPPGAQPYRPDVNPDRITAWIKDWEYLVADYKEHAKKIIENRRRNKVALDAYEGRDIGKTALSRHVCEDIAATLRHGDVCFAKLDANGRVTGLYPVMISRELAKFAPLQLLPPGVAPAKTLDELSPADRVFGWVAQQDDKPRYRGKRAYKGQLRMVSLQYSSCKDAKGDDSPPVTTFSEPGLPLAILSTPKPEQARFYAAMNRSGLPQRDGIDKAAAAYDSPDKGLRGRKVYPHHRDLPDDYWDGPAALRAVRDQPDRPQKIGGRFREYVRIAEDTRSLRDDQNRSIEGWVNPGAQFRAEIDVVNLSEVELGALVFLLSLPADCHFRLGGGKPLGFGSVHVALAAIDLADGAAIRKDLVSILPANPAEADTGHLRKVKEAERLTDVFKDRIARAYGDGRTPPEEIPLLKSFLVAARGHADGRPTHYPRAADAGWDGRTPVPPNPEGKNFEWFIENDRAGRFGSGPKQSLDPLWKPSGLMMLGVKEEPRSTGQRSSWTKGGPHSGFR